MTKPPLQCMCVESGALRPRFDIPTARHDGDGLLRLFRLAMGLHVLTGVNSTIPETREYWRAKHPETEPMWVKRDD